MNTQGLKDLFFRNGHLLVLTIVVLVLAGLSALNNLPRIEDPRIATRNALIITSFPGASAERVEALVSKKLEDALRDVEEIKKVQSTSRANISIISVELEDYIDSTTNEQAFSRVRDKLSDAEAELPAGASKPVFDDERGASAFALVVALSVPDQEEALGLLSRLAEELADRFRNVSGAERISVYGDTSEEITVTLKRGELAAQGLSAQFIAEAVASADPKNASGAMRGDQRDLFIEVAGELDSVTRIRNLVLREGEQGRVLRLGDVADVERHWVEPPDTIGFVNGQRTIFVAASAEPGVRIDRWQARAQNALDQFESQLDDGVQVEVIFNQSEYTAERLSSLSNNLFLGAVVVMIVVLVGLGWRAAIIVGAALPLSASATLFGLTFFDQQIHQMTMFGMIIAIGLLIDNAIVVTDEVQRRIQNGATRRAAVGDSVGHLFAPLLASTVTTILGFMPIFLLPGNIGDFVGPIAISVVLALAASFVISMTVIAALGGRFVPQGAVSTERAQHWWQRGICIPSLTEKSRRFLTWAFERPLLTVLATLILPISGFILATTLSLQFFPPAERDQFEIELWMPDDASLARTRDTALAIDEILASYESVSQVSWLVGGSHPQIYYNRIMKQDSNSSYAHAMVQTVDAKAATRLVVELRDVLEPKFTEAQIIVAPFAQGPPVDAPLGFRIVGPSQSVLNELGQSLRAIMHEVPSISHTRASLSSRAKLSFEADQTTAQRVGLSLDGVANQLQGNLEGITGGSVREDLEELPVRIRYDGDVRSSLEDITSMPLLGGAPNTWIPADTLGDMQLTPEGASITRRDGERVNIVHGWVTPGALPIEASNQVLALLQQRGFELPPGYSLALEGDSDAQQEAVGKLTTYLPVLLMLMVTTLVLSFRSGKAATIVGMVALLSAGLGMLSLWLSGFNLGFNPLLGSAGLIGVAINGAIVVLAGLRADPDAQTGDTKAIVNVTLRETRHVLATTATTTGGFLPLLIFAGGEFWPPLAVVIAGGVGFSVTLSLLFTPAIFKLTVSSKNVVERAQKGATGLLTAIGLSACAVGPDYVPPSVPDTTWVSGPAVAVSDESLKDWWRGFDDPLIEKYVELSIQQNQDLNIAAARLKEAKAARRGSRSLLLPQIGSQASYTDFRLSEQSQAVATAGGQGPISGEIFEAGFDASWEADVFGGLRRGLESSDAAVGASMAEVQAVRLAVIAEVVRSFVELRGAQARLKVALENESVQEQTLDLVIGRVDSGLAPELDKLNATAQLEQTRGSIPQLEALIRLQIYRLATLVGEQANTVETELAVKQPIPAYANTLNPGLRGDVLRRRPDIIAAERRLAASNADIGSALSEYFPKLVLSGQFGWSALDAGGIGEGDNRSSAFLPVIRLPLFTGGRIKSGVEAAKARYEAASLAYEQTLLLAIEESEGALVRYQNAEISRGHLSDSADASAEAADIAKKLYDSGLTDFLSVLDADRRRLEAEDALVSRQTETMVNLVAVYKALGAS